MAAISCRVDVFPKLQRLWVLIVNNCINVVVLLYSQYEFRFSYNNDIFMSINTLDAVETCHSSIEIFKSPKLSWLKFTNIHHPVYIIKMIFFLKKHKICKVFAKLLTFVATAISLVIRKIYSSFKVSIPLVSNASLENNVER